MSAKDLERLLSEAGTPERAQASAWFFKTKPGEYGHGDKFYGVSVPEQRKLIRGFRELPLTEVEKLLQSDYHEARLSACLILVEQYKRGNGDEKQGIYDFYLEHTQWINNWDLVDSSAGSIVGAHLGDRALPVLKPLAQSNNLWERRIAMLSCFYNIYEGKAEPALTIASILADDSHDLIQKAVGWMLREVGKRVGQDVEEAWLRADGRYKSLPRTTLRYAIERFEPELRQQYLKGAI